MLEEYEEFVSMLKRCGGVACGTATVESSVGSSLSPSSSASPLRGWYVAAVAATTSDATHMCGPSATPSSSSAGGGSVPSSFLAATPMGATSSTRDTVLFVVSEACVANTTAPVLCGALTHDLVRSAHQDVPLSVLVPLLYNAVRTTMGSAAASGRSHRRDDETGGGGAGSSMLVTIDAHTKRLVLVVDIRGALRRQVVVHLVAVDSAERRRQALAFVTTSLMAAHTAAMGLLDREKRSRQDAEERLARAQAQLSERGGGKLGEEAVQQHGHSSAGRIQKPSSFLNPQQKGPTKRPRGVKLN